MIRLLLSNLFLLLLINAQQLPTCSRQYVRREIRELIASDGQLNDQGRAFIQGIQCLQNATGQTGSLYDDFTQVHLDASETAHGVAAFLPWHRLFLYAIEEAMRECTGNRDLALPYWDASLDSQAPERSVVWSYFGGNGRGRRGCVTDGPFADHTPTHPERHCLTRSFGGDTIPAPEVVDFIQRTDDYDSFRDGLESQYHGSVHVWIGGDMENMHSTNDPMFFLHHTAVDAFWAEWQQLHPSSATSFHGRGFRAQSQSSDILDMGVVQRYAANHPVSNMFDTNSWCYTYSHGVSPETSDIPIPTDRPSRGRPEQGGDTRGRPEQGGDTRRRPEQEGETRRRPEQEGSGSESEETGEDEGRRQETGGQRGTPAGRTSHENTWQRWQNWFSGGHSSTHVLWRRSYDDDYEPSKGDEYKEHRQPYETKDDDYKKVEHHHKKHRYHQKDSHRPEKEYGQEYRPEKKHHKHGQYKNGHKQHKYDNGYKQERQYGHHQKKVHHKKHHRQHYKNKKHGYSGSPYNRETPKNEDRYDAFNIRKHTPLPSEYIKRNHLNETMIRSYENMVYDYVDYVNSIDGYISPCALTYHIQEKYHAVTDSEYKTRKDVQKVLSEGGKKKMGIPTDKPYEQVLH